MKYLLFSILILSSCGKNSAHQGQDLSDSDGDQISDSFDKDKYVSDLADLGQVKGTLKIKLANSNISLNFSNRASTRKGILKLLTTGKQTKWGDLDIDVPALPILDLDSYQIELDFTFIGDRPSQLSFQSPNEKLNLGPWNQHMPITMTHDQVTKLLAGRAHFKLIRNDFVTEASLDKKTYEVYCDNGQRSFMKNVAHQMNFQQFLDWQRVENVNPVNAIDLMFAWPSADKVWWYNQIENKRFALAYASTAELKENLLEGFTSTTFSVSRENGSPVDYKSMVSFKGSIHFYRIRASKLMNVMLDSQGFDLAAEPNPARGECSYTKRRIIGTRAVSVTKDDIINEIRIKTNEQLITLNDLDAKIEEKNDAHGTYWEVGFKSPSSALKMTLIENPANTFVKTGIVQSNCFFDLKPKTDNSTANLENNLTLSIESFIEKME